MRIVDRIKYDAPDDTQIVWKFPGEDLRLGSQLIVNQSQEVVFVKGGQALDTFGPGTHTLSTGNLPLLNRLVNFPFGGKTPFSAEVWYVNTMVKRDMKWGTKGPVQIIDPQFNFPVSVRAFGRWGFRIDEPRSFVVKLVGTLRTTDSARIEEHFTGEITQRLSDALAKCLVEKQTSVFQANARLNEISAFVTGDITPEFTRFGIEIINFNIERVSIPEEEQKKFQEVLGKRMEIEQISGAKVGQAYATMRTFDTLEKAAVNEGGGSGQLLGAGLGIGAGLGAGVPIGQQLGHAMNIHPEQPVTDDPMAKLQKLKQILDGGLITQEDFDAKKKTILESL